MSASPPPTVSWQSPESQAGPAPGIEFAPHGGRLVAYIIDSIIVSIVLGTLIGIIPGSFVFVNLGQTLGRIDSLSGLLSPETVGAFALLGVLSLVPVLVKKFRPSPAEKA